MKTNLNKANTGSYQLIFPKLPFRSTIEDSEVLTLNIHGTVIPSMTLTNTEMHWMGGKYDFAIPPIVFEPWYTNFTVDSNFKNWFILYEWMTTINNNKDHYDRKPDDYWINASLIVTNNFEQHVMTLKIENLFPTMLGEITLSSREGEQNLESSVNFMYTRYECEMVSKV